MSKRSFLVLALWGLAAGLRPEEKSLQAQLNDLKAQVETIQQNYERPKPVGDKAVTATACSVEGPLVINMTMVGILQGRVGAGDQPADAAGNTRSANQTAATGQVDLSFAGKPMRDIFLFLDLNSGVGPGLDSLAPSSVTLNPSYLNGSGGPSVREAWVEAQALGNSFGVQGGVIDLTKVFDANLVANDETSQFLTGSFVHSPILAAPATAPGLILRADFSRVNLKLGVQDSLRTTVGMSDDVYSIAELGLHYNFLGDGQWRLWARQQPRGSNQPDQAFGLSSDHCVSPRVTTFWRYAKQGYVDAFDGGNHVALNRYDWAASGGFELGELWVQASKDRLGLGYGRNDLQNGDREDFSELYYKRMLTPCFAVSLIGQAVFDRVRGAAGADALPNIYALGLRSLISY